MRTLNLHSPRDDTSALRRWTHIKRDRERDTLGREMLAEMRRLRSEIVALRVVLERRAA